MLKHGCYDQNKKWSLYLKPAEDNILNVEESLKGHYELGFS